VTLRARVAEAEAAAAAAETAASAAAHEAAVAAQEYSAEVIIIHLTTDTVITVLIRLIDGQAG
jgi:hypothetical protein